MTPLDIAQDLMVSVSREQMATIHDKPMAAEGLVSYRYRGRYGWVMIGAVDDKDALNEARRSINGPVTIDRLEVWSTEGGGYIPAQ